MIILSQSDMGEANKRIEEFKIAIPKLEKIVTETNESGALVNLLNIISNYENSIVQIRSMEEFHDVLEEELDKLVDLGDEVYIKIGKKNPENFYALIVMSIDSFVNGFDEATLDYVEKNSDIGRIRKNLLNQIKHIRSIIKTYEESLKIPFNQNMKDKFENKIKEISKKLKIYLEPQNIKEEKFEINSVDSDKILDLYEEIKSMPEGELKQQKIRELERLQMILKKSVLHYKNKIYSKIK